MPSGSRHTFSRPFFIRCSALFATSRASVAYGFSTTPSAAGLPPLVLLATAFGLFCFLCLFVALRSRNTEQLLRQSRDDLELALTEAGLILWSWDIPKGEITLGTAGTSRPCPGKTSSEDIKTWNNHIHPDDLEKVLKNQQEHLRGNTPSFRCEHRMKGSDGEWKWVLSSGRVTSRDRLGNPLLFSGIHMDITELRQSREELQEKETLLQAFMRFFPGSAFITEEDSRVVYTNTEMGNTCPGKGISPLRDPVYTPEVARALSLYDMRTKEEGAIDFLIDLPDRSDKLRTFHFFKFRIDREGKPPLIGNFALDVKGQKRQEEAFRSLLNALPNPTLLLDQEDMVLTANLSACRELGRPLEDVIGHSYFQLLPTGSAPLVREYVESMKRTLQNVSFEEERQDSSFSNSFFPILDSMGNYQGFAVVAFNITRTKLAERKFRTSEAQLRTVIDTVPHRISTLDASGRFVLVNRAAASLYGLSPNDMKGLKPEDLLSADSPNRGFGPEDLIVIETDQPLVIPREKVMDRRGETLFQKTIKMPILLSESGGKGLLAVSVDITDLVRAEEQIRKFTEELEEKVRQRTEELEAANQELTTFAYTVSHDLRAPLRAMEGFARILIEEKGPLLDDEGKRFLERIAGAGRKMNLLIEGLLQFSRGSRMKMDCLSIPISNLVQEICREIQATTPQRVVRWEIQPNLKTRGDPQLLRIVLENLLGNAWKFTSKQTSAVIGFGITQTEKGQAFFVKDNGPGFDKTRSEIIFDVFQRLHPDSAFEGSGIGLATVRRILERHEGQTWACSENGEGATFFFSLPEEPAEMKPGHPSEQRIDETPIDEQRRYDLE